MEPTKPHNIQSTDTQYLTQMEKRSNETKKRIEGIMEKSSNEIKKQLEGITEADHKMNKLDPSLFTRINKAMIEASYAGESFHLFEGTEGVVVVTQKAWNKYGSSPGWDPDRHVECDPINEEWREIYEKCWSFYKTTNHITE